MLQLYERAIDSGGHPNERGVVSSLKIEDLHPSRPDTITVGVGVLYPGTSIALTSLKASIDVAIGVAKIIGLI